MCNVAYHQAKEDRNYLWRTYGHAYDMTGGYVDCEHFERLLENPTKKAAAKEYEEQIRYWFQVGFGDNFGEFGESKSDEKVIEIAARYGCEI